MLDNIVIEYVKCVDTDFCIDKITKGRIYPVFDISFSHGKTLFYIYDDNRKYSVVEADRFSNADSNITRRELEIKTERLLKENKLLNARWKALKDKCSYLVDVALANYDLDEKDRFDGKIGGITDIIRYIQILENTHMMYF